MNVELSSIALRAALEAAAYYEGESPGLGAHFLTEVEDTLIRIGENPRMYAALRGNIRQAKVRVFPFGIRYEILSDHISVLEIRDLRRRPKP